MKRVTDSLLIICFALALIALPVLGAVEPDVEFTATENRLLQQTPQLEKREFAAFTADCEAYVVDQLPQRERLLSAYSNLQLGMGRLLVRNLYTIDNHWILSREYERDNAQMEAYTKAVAGAAQTHPQTQFCYMMVPFKTGALYRLAPEYVSNRYAQSNQTAVMARLRGIENLLPVDVVQYFEKNCTVDELRTLYYQTDFHWNAIGAQKAADYLTQSLVDKGLLPEAAQQTAAAALERRELAGRYEGDLNRQLSGAITAEETVPVLRLKDAQRVRYFMSVDDAKPAARTEIIGTGDEKQTVTYNDIYTENLGYYRVMNPDACTNKRVLILKDSFQNPTTDYFTALFSEVDIVDPRYYQEPYSFQALLDARKPDLVLFLYHQSNFSPELVEFLTPKP